MTNIRNFRGHNFHGWQNWCGGWSIFNILVKKIEKKFMWTGKEVNLIFLTISVKESTETSYSDKTIFTSSLLWSRVRVRKLVTFGIFVKTKGTVFLYFIREPVFKISEWMFSFVDFIYLFIFFIIVLQLCLHIKYI